MFKPFDELTKKEKLERWTNVVRVMQKLTKHQRKHHFFMENWGEETDCGTKACAAGFCGMDPWFQAQGIELQQDESKEVYGFRVDNVLLLGSSYSLKIMLSKFFGYEGTRKIFYGEINEIGSQDLNKTYAQVMRQIRNHVKELSK